MSVPAWYNENEPHFAPLFKDQDMTSAENKSNMTWCLNNMLNGTNGAFLDPESASMSLVPCILAAGSDLMDRHKKAKLNK
jgi:PAB1-binding protein PBP1